MVRWKRGSVFARSFGPRALACAVGVGACSSGYDSRSEPSAVGGDFGAAGAGTGIGAATSTGGQVGIGVGGFSEPVCEEPSTGPAVFENEMFDATRPSRRELYSWTTDEQVVELRRDRVLFTRSEAAGLGPGYAFTSLQALAETSADRVQAGLAKILTGALFSKKRYAWPAPWATRMGWPGEDYGGNLLRVVLKPEAWVVVADGAALRVFDQNNLHIDNEVAVANPERIGAIFYVRSGADGGPQCGSFGNGAEGYREYILGNLAMVEEWSLGTAAIRDRLVSDIDRLARLFPLIRRCPANGTSLQWNQQVMCRWLGGTTGPVSERSAYEQSLAIPSANYLTAPMQLANLIETLQGDLFELDPFVVKPGSP